MSEIQYTSRRERRAAEEAGSGARRRAVPEAPLAAQEAASSTPATIALGTVTPKSEKPAKGGFAALRGNKFLLAGQAAVVVALLVAVGAFVALNKPVNVTVDGQREVVRTFGQDVSDVLASKDITLTDRDEVQPGASSPVSRDMNIVVNRAKQVDVSVDGKSSSEWTTAATVNAALADLGVDARDAKLSREGDDRLNTSGESIQVFTNKALNVVADGKSVKVKETVGTVSDALDQAGVKVGKDDVVSVPVTSAAMDGQTVKVLRVKNEKKTEEKKVDFTTEVKKSDTLAKGEKKVQTKGKQGVTEETAQVRTVDGVEVARKVLDTKEKSKPVAEVVLQGTKESSGDSGSGDTGSGDSGGGGNMSKQEIIDMLGGPGTDWYKIVKCESEFNPKAVNRSNGKYFGLFQFGIPTWQGVGGSGNPADASPREQFDRAIKLQKQYGWSQWECAGKTGVS